MVLSRPRASILIALFLCLSGGSGFGQPSVTLPSSVSYPWIKDDISRETLAGRIAAPDGFQRVPALSGSFAAWLRSLPLKADGSRVRLYNGSYKVNQLAHLAVIDIDVGKRDLQQCADAVMRLRAEYLYGQNRHKEISFNFTNGKRVTFTSRSRSRDYKSFRKYMNLIFAYAGTYSLERELKKVDVKDMAIGDVFIKGGFPGHAILVADMVRHRESGERRFLLIQSYMPAQDMHVLRNPANPSSAWYSADFGDSLITPEWAFKAEHLRRFGGD